MTMPNQLVFVATDGLGRLQSADRQVIRRHCMLGKNKQRTSRRGKREAAQATDGSSRTAEKHDKALEWQLTPSQRAAVTASEVEPRPGRSMGEWRRDVASGQVCVPPPPPSDWALFRFPEELDILGQELMHKC